MLLGILKMRHLSSDFGVPCSSTNNSSGKAQKVPFKLFWRKSGFPGPSVTTDKTGSYLHPFPVLCRQCTPRTALLQQPKLSKDCGQFLMRPTLTLSVWSQLASLWRSCWLTPLAPQAPSLQ